MSGTFLLIGLRNAVFKVGGKRGNIQSTFYFPFTLMYIKHIIHLVYPKYRINEYKNARKQITKKIPSGVV